MIPKGFENRWVNDEKILGMALLVDVRNLFEQLDVPACLIFGTLLGATRINDIMPWDDDIDVSINMKDWDKVLEFDGKYVSDLPINERASRRFKIGTPVRFERILDRDMHPFMRAFRGDYEFPFIDIFTHEQMDGYVRCYGSRSNHYSDIPTDDFFPYSEIELDGSTFVAPANPEAFCDTHYPQWRTVAKTWGWDHRNDCESPNKTFSAVWNYEEKQLGPLLDGST